MTSTKDIGMKNRMDVVVAITALLTIYAISYFSSKDFTNGTVTGYGIGVFYMIFLDIARGRK